MLEVSMTRFIAAALGTFLVMGAAPAWADDEVFTPLSFFYPLVTRRPVVEREVELKVRHEKAHDGRLTERSL
jgi:hypothetical protein